MRLTSRSLALLLSTVGVQSFAPPPNRISSCSDRRWAQQSSLSSSSASELSGLLNEYKSGVTGSTVSSVIDSVSSPAPAPLVDVESTMSSLNDAVNSASDAAEQAAKAAAAAMATAAKVSVEILFVYRVFCTSIIHHLTQ